MVLYHEVGELALEAGRFHDVVVNPVVVAATGLAEDDAVVLEAVLFQPRLGHFPVGFGAGGKKGNDMPLIVPFVADFEGIRVGRHDGHALGLLVRHVVADRAVYIYEKVLLVFLQHGADKFAFFIEGFDQLSRIIFHE